MAETMAKLMLRIGLSFDELNKDFIKAESTLKSNMDRLGRENTLIKLRAQVDLASVTDATQKLKIQQEALNKQIEIQKNKLQLSTIAWKEAVQRQGEHSKQAQQTAIAIEREKLKLIELEQELKKVGEQQKALPKADNSLVAGYKGFKNNISNMYGKTIGELAGKFNELSTASQSADGAITKSLEIIGSIPHPVARAVAAVASIPLIFKGIENSIINTAKAAAAAGDSVYVMSRGFQMSIADTGKFTTNCKVAGVEVMDLASTVKRLQQSVLKAGSSGNAVTKMLQRYGVSIYDANGNLKNLNDMTMALSQGLKKAQAEGNGAAFVLTAFKNASGDAITAIEDWADVNEQAATIVKNGLANPALAHQVQGNINAMNMQASQLNASFASVMLPVANEIIPRVTDRMGQLVQFLADNKEEIKAVGTALGKTFNTIESIAEVPFIALGKTYTLLKDIYSLANTENNTIKLYLDDSQVKSAEDLLKKELQRTFSFTERAAIEANPALYQQTLARYEPMFKALEEAREKVKKSTDEINEQLSKPAPVAGISTIAAERESREFEEKRAAAKEAIKQQEQLSDELYRITHDEYENKIFEVRKWNQELLNNENTTAEEREIIAKLYAAKLENIEKDRADRIAEIVEQEESKYRSALDNEIANAEKAKEQWIKIGMDKAQAEELAQKRINKAQEEAAKKAQEYIREAADIEFELTHTAFEKQLRDIERWKEAQLEKADTAEEVAAIIKDAAAKEAEAFEREVERIKGLTQSLEDEIFEMENSQYEADKRRAMQKAQRFIDEGGDAALAQRFLRDKLAQADEKARNDKTGTYTKAPKSGNANPYVIEFDKKPMQEAIGLFTDQNKIMERLKNSTQQVVDAQSLLAQQTRSGIEIIQGTESNLSGFSNALQNAEQFKTQAVSQSTLSQADFQAMVAQLERTQITKDSYGSYGAAEGGIADLHNFINALENTGAQWSQITSILDDIISVQQSRRESGGQQGGGTTNISPSITINIDGNADTEILEEAENRIARKIADAVQSAASGSNRDYSYAN